MTRPALLILPFAIPLLPACGGSGGGGEAHADSEEITHRVRSLETQVAGLEGEIIALRAAVANQEAILQERNEVLELLEIVEIDTGGGKAKTIRVSGANLQIVNGQGRTDSTNGLGNLIVGYNEPAQGLARGGSHNLVAGTRNEYTSFGGFVAGEENDITGPFASVAGGRLNQAGGRSSAILGGLGNKARGLQATVSGGDRNDAAGKASSIAGGVLNLTTAEASAISGGAENLAQGARSVVSGGSKNQASGPDSAVGGGAFREVKGEMDWGAGDLLEDS